MGILIIWEPNGIQNEKNVETFFNISTEIIGDKEEKNISFFQRVSSFEGQHKIHSLNASTFYRVIIKQYNHEEKELET